MQANISDRELRLLKVFVTIVEAGGFTPACARLNIAESTISTHMATLERRLGLRLCERGRGGFRVTPSGQAVYDEARRLLQGLDDFRSNIASLKHELSGTIRLGLPDASVTHGSNFAASALRNLADRFPHIHIELETGSPRLLEQRVLDGRLHAAISPEHGRVAGLAYERLVREVNLLYCARSHPWFGIADRDFSIDEFIAAGCISRGYHENFDRNLLGDVRHAATASSIEATAHLVMSGKYIGFLPEHHAANWVRTGEMRAIRPDTLRYEIAFALISQIHTARDAIVQALLASLNGRAGTAARP